MNLINGELELWKYITRKCCTPKSIIAFSNRGRIRRQDGSVRFSKYTDLVRIEGKQIQFYHLLADNFIPKTVEDIELGRNEIDHITHQPGGMNINDLRNLRWCTHSENMNFPERRKKLSVTKTGKKLNSLALEKRRKRMLDKQTVSDFGKKYFTHFGYGRCENPEQYNRERYWYLKHNNVCSWE